MPNQWDTYTELVLNLEPVLARMTTHGVRVDTEAQQKLGVMLQARSDELVEAIRAQVPDSLRPRKRYKKFPSEERLSAGAPLEEIKVPAKVKSCSVCGEMGITKTKHMKRGCRKAEVLLVDGEVSEWDLLLPFNPSSGPQMLDFCKWAKHPIARNYKTNRPTLDDTQLEKLERKYGHKWAIYGQLRELREIDKTHSTYVVGFTPTLPGDRITGNYVNSPKTGRLGQRNVTLMNVPHKEDHPFAQAIRRTILPSPGHVFVEADSSAIEAVLTGYLAQDPLLLELATKGVHTYLCCKKLGIEFDASKAQKTWISTHHQALYDSMKRTVYLSLYGGTPKMMTKASPELFPTEIAAKATQDFFLEQFPAVKVWWAHTREVAHKQCYLVNPWGWRNYYYNVFRKDPNGTTVLGEDKNEVVAFLPQSVAGCFMRENLVLLGSSWAAPYMPANGVVHDSYCLDVPLALKDDAIELLTRTLTREIPQLGGLKIGCEIKVGENWGDMEKVT